MYTITKTHYLEGWTEEVKQISNAAIAYDFAHELHAATMGINDDEKMNEEHAGPFAIMIVDENGENKWGECSRARCPVAGSIH